MKNKKKNKNQNNQALSIVCLILNILFLPGLGSLIGGKTTAGVWQLILFFVGVLFTITIIGALLGIPMIIASWIWGIVTGVNIVKESN